MKYHNVRFDSEACFRLRVMDAYHRMEPKNVRSLCKTFGISKSWFYKWKGRYNPRNLTSLKSLSRKPKKLSSIGWGIVVEVCEWKRINPRKSQYYLFNEWLKAGRVPPCSPKTIYNWWKRRNLILTRHKRKRVKSKLFNKARLPGELVQMDTKFLPRKKYQYTAIDVVSKWRYLQVYAKLTQENTIDFVQKLLIEAKRKRINIKLIQTDNGLEFQGRFHQMCEEMKLKHHLIHKNTPNENALIERSFRTDEEEFFFWLEKPPNITMS